jgi:hypothetical protein
LELTLRTPSLQPSILKIIVGEGEDIQDFRIHESVLTARSKFFKAAMGTRWRTAKEKTVNLPEDDPEAFQLYTQLVYTDRIPGMNDDIPNKVDGVEESYESRITLDKCGSPNACEADYQMLCRLYVLAEKLMDVKAKNYTMEALYSKIQVECSKCKNPQDTCLPCVDAITIMYNGTSKYCAGRQILLTTYIHFANGETYAEKFSHNDLPEDFLRDLVEGLLISRNLRWDRFMHGSFDDSGFLEVEDGESWSYQYW